MWFCKHVQRKTYSNVPTKLNWKNDGIKCCAIFIFRLKWHFNCNWLTLNLHHKNEALEMFRHQTKNLVEATNYSETNLVELLNICWRSISNKLLIMQQFMLILTLFSRVRNKFIARERMLSLVLTWIIHECGFFFFKKKSALWASFERANTTATTIPNGIWQIK